MNPDVDMDDAQEAPVTGPLSHPFPPIPGTYVYLPGPHNLGLGNTLFPVPPGGTIPEWSMPPSYPQWLYDGVGQTIQSLARWSIETETTAIDSTAGHTIIGSYNWVIAPLSRPAIDIPGTAPYYQAPTMPHALTRDTHVIILDEDRLRSPEFPFLPVFRAIEEMMPGTNFDNIDVVVDVPSLSKLLDCVIGRNGKEIRLDMSIMNRTLFVTSRYEDNVVDVGVNQREYQESFRKAFTASGGMSAKGINMNDMTSHNRLIVYQFGSLNIAVRSTVDGTTLEHNAAPKAARTITGRDKAKAAVRKLMGGLWFGRMESVIYGERDYALVKDVKVLDISAKFAKFERKNQESLRKVDVE